MSGLFGSITIKGNRLTDLVGQTSTVGKPIPYGYGYCKITEPNVIWTAGIPKEHVKKKKQGKGGVKTEEYTYTLSYAIAFMAGPVYGYFTIKRGGKVVFTTDPNATIEDQQYADKWRQKAKLYLGTRTQLPDATIESYKGVGQVSAFRDLAYIVVEDDDVTGEGGAVPQYEAVIIATPPDVYLTSRPYPLDMLPEAIDTSAVELIDGDLREIIHNAVYSESVDEPVVSLSNGELRSTVQEYAPLPEAVDAAVVLTDAQLNNVVQYYTMKPEGIGESVVTVTAGEMRVVVITYNTGLPEGVNSTISITEGYLG